MRLCNGYVGKENYRHSDIISLNDVSAVTTNADKNGRKRRVHIWKLEMRTDPRMDNAKYVHAELIHSFDFKLFNQRG